MTENVSLPFFWFEGTFTLDQEFPAERLRAARGEAYRCKMPLGDSPVAATPARTPSNASGHTADTVANTVSLFWYRLREQNTLPTAFISTTGAPFANVNVGMRAALDRILSSEPKNWPNSLTSVNAVAGACKRSSEAENLPFRNPDEYIAFFTQLVDIEVCSELYNAFDSVLRTLSAALTPEKSGLVVLVSTRGDPVPVEPRGATKVSAEPVSTHDEPGSSALVEVPIKIQSKETIFDHDILLLLPCTREDQRLTGAQLREIRQQPLLGIVQHRAGSPLMLRMQRARAEAWLEQQQQQQRQWETARTDCSSGPLNSAIGSENAACTPPTPAIRLMSTLNHARELGALSSIAEMELAPVILDPAGAAAEQQRELAPGPQRSELDAYLAVISNQRGLNRSQYEAVRASVHRQRGFALIHGPPGTGKTKTLLSLLNLLHMSKYQEYYDAYLSALGSPAAQEEERPRTSCDQSTLPTAGTDSTPKPILEQLLDSVRNTTAAATAAVKLSALRTARHTAALQRKPRLLVTAQSNAAVDEIVVRIMREGFVDGKLRTYYPDIVRIGAGARVHPKARAVTAEARAEAFLQALESAKHSAEWIQHWEQQCRALLGQLETPAPPQHDLEARGRLMRLWDRLDRLQRDERRYRMATWPDQRISREQRIAWIAGTYLEEAEIVLCTLSGAALIKSWLRDAPLASEARSLPERSGESVSTLDGAFQARASTFPIVVIDEAAQATELATLIPLQYGCERCVLAGDPQQLPATVFSRGDAGVALARSLMERLLQAGWTGHLLDTQYRMHPAIATFPTRWFYQNQLKNDDCVRSELYRPAFHRTGPPPPLLGPYCFVDIAEATEERDATTASLSNPKEAAFAMQLVEILYERYWKASDRVWHLGILTPYRAQMRLLQQALDQSGLILPGQQMPCTIEIDTVDAFQGREKDVIIFSAVRTAQHRSGIGFVGDVRRLNVALTRAKVSLVVLGHAAALRAHSADWDALLCDAEQRGLYFESSSDLVQSWLQRHRSSATASGSGSGAAGSIPPRPSSTRSVSSDAMDTRDEAATPAAAASSQAPTSAARDSSTGAASTAAVAFASALDPRLQRTAAVYSIRNGSDASMSGGVSGQSTPQVQAAAIDARSFMIASLTAGFSLPSVVAAAYQAFPHEADQVAQLATELAAQTGAVLAAMVTNAPQHAVETVGRARRACARRKHKATGLRERTASKHGSVGNPLHQRHSGEGANGAASEAASTSTRSPR